MQSNRYKRGDGLLVKYTRADADGWNPRGEGLEWANRIVRIVVIKEFKGSRSQEPGTSCEVLGE